MVQEILELVRDAEREYWEGAFEQWASEWEEDYINEKLREAENDPQ